MHPFELFLARCSSWYYKGSRYRCNICGFGARQLKWRGHDLPVLQKKKVLSAGRRRSDCPNCLSSDRDRLLWLYLAQNPKSPYRILHVAPELPIAKMIKHSREWADVSYECIDKKTKGYFYPKWVKDGDITQLNYPDSHFDLIIANHVLEHITDLTKALKELKRVLKQGGEGIFMVPLSQNHPTDEGCVKCEGNYFCPLSESERISRFGQHDHVRLFGTDIEEIFRDNGWQIHQLNAKNLLLDENTFSLLHLYPGEKLLIANKI
jgi:SAM-dependent methyltransferase